MPGPPPKDPKVRQRRNKEPTAQTLLDQNPLAIGEVPKLPAKRKAAGQKKAQAWLPATRELWREIWTGPVGQALCRTDVHLVLVYVDLMDDYLRTKDRDVLKEARMQAQNLGLGPIARRRLGWSIESRVPEGAVSPTRRRDPRRDPRAALTVHDGGRA